MMSIFFGFFNIKLCLGSSPVNVAYGSDNVNDKLNFTFTASEDVNINSITLCHTLNNHLNDLSKFSESSKPNFTINKNQQNLEKNQSFTISKKSKDIDANYMYTFKVVANNKVYYTDKSFLMKTKKTEGKGYICSWTSNPEDISNYRKGDDKKNKSKSKDDDDKDDSGSQTLWIVLASVAAGIAILLLLVLAVKMCSAI